MAKKKKKKKKKKEKKGKKKKKTWRSPHGPVVNKKKKRKGRKEEIYNHKELNSTNKLSKLGELLAPNKNFILLDT